MQQLQARMQQLDKREQQIQEDEQRIEALRRDFEALAQRHKKALAEAAAAREAQKSNMEKDPTQESLAHLIKVYEAMDPEEAALRVGKMKQSLALDILAGIKEKKAASVLAGVEPGRAAKLSEGLRYYKKNKSP